MDYYLVIRIYDDGSCTATRETNTECYYRSGPVEGRSTYHVPDTSAGWKALISNLVEDVKEDIDATRKRLERISATLPDVWFFWDFLYFSTIVQTTVGFGDILPNSTVVRLVSVFRVLLGDAALIYILNLVLLS